MLTGKAIACAVRGHFIIEAALNALILSRIYHVSDVDAESSEELGEKEVLDEAAILFDKLNKGVVSAEDICKNVILSEINTALQAQKDLVKSSRTAMQYMEMVDILWKYIRAERTGKWELHLQALSEMLSYMAASGHNNYTKSGLIYLQRMSHLEIDHPEVYQHFQNGLHVTRRSERYWAGLSTDLVIEQVLMRSMKTSGGLTRGRGMTEQQRVIWSLALPACAEVNRAMQELTGVLFNSGEQNQDMTQSRQVRDWKDTQALLCFLQESNPFIADPSLRNICTGVHVVVIPCVPGVYTIYTRYCVNKPEGVARGFISTIPSVNGIHTRWAWNR